MSEGPGIRVPGAGREHSDSGVRRGEGLGFRFYPELKSGTNTGNQFRCFTFLKGVEWERERERGRWFGN